MAVLPTHNLIWLKPHAGSVAGQPISFKEKMNSIARLRRMAFKGMIGRAEDHPELVAKYEKMVAKSLEEALVKSAEGDDLKELVASNEAAAAEALKSSVENSPEGEESDPTSEETIEDLLEEKEEAPVAEEAPKKSRKRRK